MLRLTKCPNCFEQMYMSLRRLLQLELCHASFVLLISTALHQRSGLGGQCHRMTTKTSEHQPDQRPAETCSCRQHTAAPPLLVYVLAHLNNVLLIGHCVHVLHTTVIMHHCKFGVKLKTAGASSSKHTLHTWLNILDRQYWTDSTGPTSTGPASTGRMLLDRQTHQHFSS